MAEKVVKNIKDFEPVLNVCDQELREIFSYKDVFSVAHVKMAPGNISLRHVHENMNEFYFITKGRGVLHTADWAKEVYPGAFKLVTSKRDHFLANPYEEDLEHLVIAMPPFNPEDVKILEQSDSVYTVSRFENKNEPFLSFDRAMIYELLEKTEQKDIGLSIASGYLSPHKQALMHKHENTDELYYITSGNGFLKVDGEVFKVKENDFAFIPRGSRHSLRNDSDYNLSILCIASPPYKDKDFILDN